MSMFSRLSSDYWDHDQIREEYEMNRSLPTNRYTVESTQDEYGTPRYFVMDEETGDWVSDPFDTYEQAAEEAQERNEKVQN